jgi:hypothetical protein
MPNPSPIVLGLSLGYVGYYVLASVYLTVRGRLAAGAVADPAGYASAGQLD